MLWTIIIILFVLWLLGLIGGIAGKLIYLLLLAAVALLIIQLVSGRRVSVQGDFTNRASDRCRQSSPLSPFDLEGGFQPDDSARHLFALPGQFIFGSVFRRYGGALNSPGAFGILPPTRRAPA